jgi:hypothetical protein
MNTFWFPKTSLSDPDYTPVVYGFETTEELLALEDIKRHASPEAKFVLSGKHLMLVLKDGFEWWVLGQIEYPEQVDLPKWEGPKIHVRLDDGTETVVSGEIKSICGDRILLWDGSVAARMEKL